MSSSESTAPPASSPSERRRRVAAHDAPALRGALADPDAGVRALAAQALGERGDVADRGALEELLSDGHFAVQAAAARGLGALGERAAAARLLALLEHPEELVRRHALRSVGKLGDRSCTQAVLAALPDESLRGEVIGALARLKDPAAIPDLTAVLALEEHVGAALKALGAIGDPVAHEAIFLAARRGLNPFQEWWAVAALRDIGDVAALAAATSRPEAVERKLALRTLGEFPKTRQTVEPVLRAMRSDPALEVRRSAASRVSAWGLPAELRPEVRAALEEAAGDDDGDVQHWAQRALERWDEHVAAAEEGGSR